jgi:hypothetical protein
VHLRAAQPGQAGPQRAAGRHRRHGGHRRRQGPQRRRHQAAPDLMDIDRASSKRRAARAHRPDLPDGQAGRRARGPRAAAARGATGVAGTMGGRPRRPRSPQQIRDLEGRCRPSVVTFRVRGLSYVRAGGVAEDAHPARDGQQELFNPITAPVALIAACCVDPDDPEQAKELCDKLGTGQADKLFSACWEATNGGTAGPFLRGRLRDSARAERSSSGPRPRPAPLDPAGAGRGRRQGEPLFLPGGHRLGGRPARAGAAEAAERARCAGCDGGLPGPGNQFRFEAERRAVPRLLRDRAGAGKREGTTRRTGRPPGPRG